jgi:stage II sporulation protein M
MRAASTLHMRQGFETSWQTVRGKAATQGHVWTFLMGVCLCGIFFGAVVAGQLHPGDVIVLNDTIQNLLAVAMHHQLASFSQLWWERMIDDSRLLALVWLFGVSVIGLPFVVIALFLRSFGIGFAMGFTVLQFGWKGLLIAAIGMFPHDLITMAFLLLAGVTAIRFSADILQQVTSLQRLPMRFFKYTLLFAFCAIGLMAAAALQAGTMPHLLANI